MFKGMQFLQKTEPGFLILPLFAAWIFWIIYLVRLFMSRHYERTHIQRWIHGWMVGRKEGRKEWMDMFLNSDNIYF